MSRREIEEKRMYQDARDGSVSGDGPAVRTPHGARRRRFALASAALLLAGGHVVFACIVALRWPFAPRRPPESTSPFEPIATTTEDGVPLRAWLFRAVRPSGAALVLHGYHGSAAEMASLADRLRDAGMDVLAPDFRAHGASGGWRISFGARERLDVRAALDVLDSLVGHPRAEVVTVGLSMGAAAALCDAEDVRGTAGVVLLAPFLTLEKAVDRRFRIFAAIPARPLGTSLLALTSWMVGCDPATVRPIDHVARISPTPLLLVGGRDDRRVPPEVLQDYFSRAGDPKELRILEGFDHFRLADFDDPELADSILSFAKRCLARPR